MHELLCLSNLVLIDVILGRFDAAVRDGRELAGQYRRAGFVAQLDYLLMILLIALMLRGTLDEAEGVLREAFPLLKREGSVWKRLDLFALIVFLRGRKESAARLSGAAEASLQKFGYGRAIDQRHWRDELLERLRQSFAPDVLARLTREGAEMSEPQAVVLVLTELDS